MGRECRSQGRCHTCGGRHHTSICGKMMNTVEDQSSVLKTPPVNPNPPTVAVSNNPMTTGSILNPTAPVFTTPPTSTSLYVNSSQTVLLQTALVQAHNPSNPSVEVGLRVILDSGSQRSYVTRRVKDALSLVPSNKQSLSIAAFGARRGTQRSYEMVRIVVKGRSGHQQELELFVVPHICDPLMAQSVDVNSSECAHLSQLDLADTMDSRTPMDVDVLIGSDVYWSLVTGEIVRGKCGPVAINTKLGWVLSGPTEPVGSVSLLITHALHMNTIEADGPDAVLRSFWELESLGIKGEDDATYDYFTNNVQFKNDRYEVALPWRDYHEPLPDNYNLSLSRLRGLLQRLKQNPAILREYNAIIQDQLDKGVVERVDQSDTTPRKIHYLPHHAVIRQDKETTKLRVVYDASARSNGPSLNNCLYTGPKFNQKILEILLRFRSYAIAWIADIEKAFLMISVTPRDRDVLRFLWVNDIDAGNPEVVPLRFARVVFGVSCSPFLLNATIKYHIDKYCSSHSEVVKTLLQSIYVDDVVSGADSEEEAYTLYSTSKEILSHASFNLRKFVSNSASLQDRVEMDERRFKIDSSSQQKIVEVEPLDETYVEATLPTGVSSGLGEQKVLGVRWSIQTDQLLFEFSDVANIAKLLSPTKRNVISIIGRFYDPLGYLSPAIVRFKVFMQELCRSKLTWDQCLEGEELKRWYRLVDDLDKGQPVTLPRYLLISPPSEKGPYRLYGFCDASASAYAAVVYLVEDRDDKRYSNFVVSKTRVSPLKVQTIPRLELLSAVLLSRLVVNVMTCLTTRLKLEEPRCFTDSQVALFWIKGVEKEWKPFVQHRVDEIRKLTSIDCWNHCAGKDNPADIPSRGLTPTELSTNKMWKEGPVWLNACIQESVLPDEMPDDCVKELKASVQRSEHILLAPTQTANLSNLINCKRYSTPQRLYRITACILKFIRLLKKVAQSPELTVQDVAEAEEMWIRENQFSLALNSKFSTWKVQFGLFQDERGLWRCGGRLHNANVPFTSKHPVLLDKKHHLTFLIVSEAHRRVQHNGVKETLTEVRSKYWIVGGRSVVRLHIHKCVTCRRFEGRPFCAPPAPPLPTFRVNEAPPFTNTAVDFAGPLYIRNKGVSDSNKVWLCLFTCCVTRAVHLELVLDLSTVTFVRCLKRFCARRGLPKKFLSDNAKTFKATAKTIDVMLKDEYVKNYLSHVGIEWSFNLEKAPWWGGVFERLIKSAKRCLRKVVGQAKFTYDEMHTAVVEIEAILNSRPLSYVGPDDLDEPLTPSHLLAGRRILSLPDNLSYYELDGDEDFEVSSSAVHRRAKHLNGVLNHFWKRWSKEYLLELRESHRHLATTGTVSNVKIGEVVVVHDENHPRGFWRLGQVDRLITGKDGHTRGAVVRLSNKNGHSTTLQRPLQLLYPLEISHCSEPPQQNLSTKSISQPEINSENEQPQDFLNKDNSPHRRPVRQAASRARDHFKEWSSQLLNEDR